MVNFFACLHQNRHYFHPLNRLRLSMKNHHPHREHLLRFLYSFHFMGFMMDYQNWNRLHSLLIKGFMHWRRVVLVLLGALVSFKDWKLKVLQAMSRILHSLLFSFSRALQIKDHFISLFCIANLSSFLTFVLFLFLKINFLKEMYPSFFEVLAPQVPHI